MIFPLTFEKRIGYGSHNGALDADGKQGKRG
jgi:hypothetical protein